jgi:hypothetical protein
VVPNDCRHFCREKLLALDCLVAPQVQCLELGTDLRFLKQWEELATILEAQDPGGAPPLGDSTGHTTCTTTTIAAHLHHARPNGDSTTTATTGTAASKCTSTQSWSEEVHYTAAACLVDPPAWTTEPIPGFHSSEGGVANTGTATLATLATLASSISGTTGRQADGLKPTCH